MIIPPHNLLSFLVRIPRCEIKPQPPKTSIISSRKKISYKNYSSGILLIALIPKFLLPYIRISWPSPYPYLPIWWSNLIPPCLPTPNKPSLNINILFFLFFFYILLFPVTHIPNPRSVTVLFLACLLLASSKYIRSLKRTQPTPPFPLFLSFLLDVFFLFSLYVKEEVDVVLITYVVLAGVKGKKKICWRRIYLFLSSISSYLERVYLNKIVLT